MKGVGRAALGVALVVVGACTEDLAVTDVSGDVPGTVPDVPSGGGEVISDDVSGDVPGDDADVIGGETPIGTPCEALADCPDQLCVDVGDGKACTATCNTDDDCPGGWACVQTGSSAAGIVLTCQKLHAHLCRPCRTDADCGVIGLGARCVDRGPLGSFCGGSCDADCPDGTACESVPLAEGGTAEQCVLPEGEECACNVSAMDAGAETDCAIENDAGSCTGVRQCREEGLSACSASTPAAETCGGDDENCDGATDEEGADGCTTFYLDTDGDDHGLAGDSRCLCAAEGDYTATEPGDCDDAAEAVFPGAACAPASCEGYVLTPASLCEDGSCGEVSGSPCPGGFACESATACFTACAGEGQCAPGHFCDDGTCQGALPDGSVCGADEQCASGHCGAGFCCASGDCCGGEDDQCTGASACVEAECTGAFQCQLTNLGTDVTCAPAACADGVLTPAGQCDGEGGCTPGEAAPCAGGFACLDDATCRTDCTEITHCQEGHHCLDGACAPDEANGQACEQDLQCASGHCDGGFCCDEGQCCNEDVTPGGCDDGNPCTVDTCAAFQCESADAADGLECTAAACDGDVFTPAAVCDAGACQPGGEPEDCSGDDPCKVFGCSPAGCTVQNVPAGETCAPQTCVDGTLTQATACSDGGACEDGGESAPCAGSLGCLDGTTCRTDCSEDAHCVAGFHCEGSACVADVTDGGACTAANQCASGHCEGGFCCQSGACCGGEDGHCDDGNVCTDDVCGEDFTCTNPDNEAECAPAGCDGLTFQAAGTCTGGTCVVPDEVGCGGDEPCLTYACDASAGCTETPTGDDAACGESTCEGASFTAAPLCDGSGECQPLPEPVACPGNLVCADGASCLTTCAGDDQCQSGFYCADGACLAKGADGGACSAANQCLSGHCDSGLCCAGGTCCADAEACDDGNACTADTCASSQCQNAALPDGEVCVTGSCDGLVHTPAGTCQGGTCSGPGAPIDCDGGAACTDSSCDPTLGCGEAPAEEGTTCATSSCEGAVLTPGKSCDAEGSCLADGEAGPCPGGAVCLDATTCRTDCSEDAHCQEGFHCAGEACEADKADGEACEEPSDCESGHCESGICCDEGTCCNVELEVGCDDGNPCTTDTCGDTFQCAASPHDGECGAPSCAGGALTPAPLCAGGTCQESAPAAPCSGGFGCLDETTCRATCGADEHCQAGHYCAEGACVEKRSDGSSCGAGNMCLSGHCDGGICCAGGTCCLDGGACDDGNACTADACESFQCQSSPVEDGSLCEAGTCDGLTWTAPTSCVNGQCADGGAQTDCQGPNACLAYQCDPTSGCKAFEQPPGTLCGSPSCSDATLTAAPTCVEASCDAATPDACPGHLTCASGEACRTSCESADHCVDGYFCDDGTCLAVLADGAPCEAGEQCASTHCESGICCAEGMDCCLGDGDCENDAEQCTEELCQGGNFTCGSFPVADGVPCDDGDPSTVNDQCELATCTCVADCAGRICGTNGCGGSCGDCPPDTGCTADGSGCRAEGQVCSLPFLVGPLPFSVQGDTAESSNDHYPGCTGPDGEVGPEHVYQFTAPSAGGYKVTLQSLGSPYDGLLHVFGSCLAPGSTCLGSVDVTGIDGAETLDLDLEAGETVFIAADAGAGPFDVYAGGPYQLTVTAACVPDCAGKECGADGCGSVCGVCEAGVCSPAGQCTNAGDSCQDPLVIDSLPFSGSSTTTGRSDSATAQSCAGFNGGVGPDEVYELTPAVSGQHLFFVDSGRSLYVLEACDEAACLASASPGSLFQLDLVAGQTYFVVIDAGFDGAAGDYTLIIEPPCQPQCEDKECGDDGCGGSCGACQDGLSCGAEGLCGGGEPGNTCANALPLESDINFGDTGQGFTDVFSTDEGCSGAGTLGAGTPDVIYELTPGFSGVYEVTLPNHQPGQPSLVTVTRSCAAGDLAGACLGVKDFTGTDGVSDPLVVDLLAGETYYFVVDGAAGSFSLDVEQTCFAFCGECGDDNCGGDCGGCGHLGPNAVCQAGSCACEASCDGKVCGADGCGGSCGDCDGLCSEDGSVCRTGDSCEDAFVVGGLPFTGAGDTTGAPSNLHFSEGSCPGLLDEGHGAGKPEDVWIFVPPVDAAYTVGVAGFNGVVWVFQGCDDESTCEGAARAGGQVTVALTGGAPVYIAVDGADSGTNTQGEYVLTVSEPCAQQCDGKGCGPDGCGGTCGTCGLGEQCQDGQCNEAGDVCEAPILIDGLPYQHSSDTEFRAPDLQVTDGQCPGMGAAGGASRDVVYQLTAPATAYYRIDVSGFDSAVYVLSDCGSGACVGGAQAAGAGGTESVSVSLTGGQTYFVVVDGFSDTDDISGAYTLTITEPCFPSCAGKECGGDGCGGSCGSCVPGAGCDGSSCETAGDACGEPLPVGPLPALIQGDTTSRTDTVTLSGCPEEDEPIGGEAPDVVYELTAPEAGVYTVRLDAGFDAFVALTQPCGAGGVCEEVGAAEGPGQPGDFSVALEAGETAWLVVDGNDAGEAGPYTLSVSAPCQPQCDGKACGGDGCGLSCGECGPDQGCNPDFTCVPLEDLVGNTCDNPIIVGSVPVDLAGDSSLGYTDLYSHDQGCTGAGPRGAGQPDVVYAFTPAATGIFELSMPGLVPGETPSLLSVTTDCSTGGFGGACLGAHSFFDDPSSAMFLPLEGGQTVFLIVDAFSDGEAGPFTLRITPDCEAQCDGKECGSDGCGGTCGDCGENGVCNAGVCECTPSCAGKECGGNGCGGSCGDCETGACNPQGACVLGDLCEAPFTLGVPGSVTGDTTGASNDHQAMAGACPGLDGGGGNDAPDHVYVIQPQTTGVYGLVLNGPGLAYVAQDCDAAGSACLGGVAGGLGIQPLELSAGATYYVIVDGFESGGFSYQLEITPPCQPECDGRECGDDQCGGTCGTCEEGGCNPEGQCVLPGDVCPAADVIDELPYADLGDTTGYGDTFSVPGGACAGLPNDVGEGGPDRVYTLTVPETAEYVVRAEGFPLAIYVTGDCDDPASLCLGGASGAGAAEVTVDLQAGAPYFIVVDGLNGASGELVLEVERFCEPQCGGKLCGPDGCGGLCGVCDEGAGCNDDGQCVSAGDDCEDPRVVGDLPFVAAGDLSSRTDAVSVQQGACADLPEGTEQGLGDEVWSFVAPIDGVYAMDVVTDGFDPVLTLLDECGQPASGCVAGADEDDGTEEELLVALTAGVTYYLVVEAAETVDTGTYLLAIEEPCQPQCDGRLCGDDGCEGSCGECDGGLACDGDGQCVDPGSIVGNTCENPFVVDLPAVLTGTTSGFSDSHSVDGESCTGSGFFGEGGFDVVYRFTPPESGTWNISMPTYENEGPSLVTVTSDCDASSFGQTCEGFNSFFSEDGELETLPVNLTGGVTYYLIIDGFADQDGAFEILIEEGECVPDCDGKECGGNGCGGSCGECTDGLACSPQGICGGGGGGPGDTCDSRLVVDGLPFELIASTAQLADDYSTQGQCGNPGDEGFGGQDVLVEVTAPEDGSYRWAVGGLPVVIYNVADCQNVAGTCLGSSGPLESGDGWTVDLIGGVTTTFVIDAAQPGLDGEIAVVLDAAGGEGPQARLVINEVDYDQPSTDTEEFVEIYNAGDGTANLSEWTLEHINGSGLGALWSVPLGDPGEMLPPGHMVLVASAAVAQEAPNDVVVVELPEAIQNGPDGLRLLHLDAFADGVHYEGTMPGTGEGGSAPTDSGAGSLSRCPDGQDSDDNSADFLLLESPTPGSPNACGDGGGDDVVTFSAVSPVFQEKCVPCHSDFGSGDHNMGSSDVFAGYTDSQLESYSAPGQTKGAAALVRIQAGQMPQGAGCTGDPAQDAGNPACLTQEEMDTLIDWLDDGQQPPE